MERIAQVQLAEVVRKQREDLDHILFQLMLVLGCPLACLGLVYMLVVVLGMATPGVHLRV